MKVEDQCFSAEKDKFQRSVLLEISATFILILASRKVPFWTMIVKEIS